MEVLNKFLNYKYVKEHFAVIESVIGVSQKSGDANLSR